MVHLHRKKCVHIWRFKVFRYYEDVHLTDEILPGNNSCYSVNKFLIFISMKLKQIALSSSVLKQKMSRKIQLSIFVF
jgi:hypothetical protein